MSEQKTRDEIIDEKIDEANKNINKILQFSGENKNKKFDYLPFWKHKESKLLLRELTHPRTFYKKYKRGTIIKVDFGVNIGSEFSQIHYAIVLNKKDNRKNKILNVIPLTSKDKDSTYNIGQIIFEEFIDTTRKLLNEYDNTNNNDKNDLNQLEKIKDIINYYSKNPVCSYACYKNLTTISKTRIVNPINEFDFINKAVCKDEIMKKIDKKIIEYYTNL